LRRCHFHVLVPATPASKLDQEYVSSVPEHVRAAAERQPGDDDRLEARALLEDEAADIHGDRPGEELGPGRRSRWLPTDLPSRIRRTYKLPVTQITGPAHAGPMWTTKE
jgi:hypothetical protein